MEARWNSDPRAATSFLRSSSTRRAEGTTTAQTEPTEKRRQRFAVVWSCPTDSYWTGGRQRHQTVDLVAIHDPWLVVEMRRDRRGNDGLGSGDLFRRLAGSPCLRFGGSSHALGVIRTVTTEGHRDGMRICSVRRRHHRSELRLSGNGVRPRSQSRPRSRALEDKITKANKNLFLIILLSCFLKD